MSTISNERLEEITNDKMINQGSEFAQMARELLALRKEREKAEPVGVPDLHKVVYHFRELNEGFPVERFKADYVIAWMLANYQPAPVHVDQIAAQAGIDPAIADAYMQGCHDTEARPAETDTTAQQFESLAGKAVGGWIPCSERMPEEMADVLVTDGEDVKGMWWNGREWDSWDDRYALDSDDVTHWQPLPEPPCK
ncbi:DUF551 domain-containing protein [Cronobacter turicensis]